MVERPGLTEFLKELRGFAEVVVFTAGEHRGGGWVEGREAGGSGVVMVFAAGEQRGGGGWRGFLEGCGMVRW